MYLTRTLVVGVGITSDVFSPSGMSLLKSGYQTEEPSKQATRKICVCCYLEIKVHCVFVKDHSGLPRERREGNQPLRLPLLRVFLPPILSFHGLMFRCLLDHLIGLRVYVDWAKRKSKKGKKPGSRQLIRKEKLVLLVQTRSGCFACCCCSPFFSACVARAMLYPRGQLRRTL